LLHGFPFNRSLWKPQIEALKSNYRVIVPDLRGHGETTVTAGTVTMEVMAQDVSSLMDSLEIESATVGGLSMGGYVALAFARLFPDRVNALVLADTRAQADTEEGKQNRSVQAEKALTEGMKPIVEAMLPKLVTAETMADRPDIVSHLRQMMMSTPAEGAAAALLGMGARQDQREFITQIKVPTLVTVGRNDPITPLADSELMHEKIGGSRLVVIDGAAHVSNLEQPDQFNGALVSFLNENSA
jgi:3-oxoadipate enol-lactonase